MFEKCIHACTSFTTSVSKAPEYAWELFAFFIVCKKANNFTVCLQTNKQFANNIENDFIGFSTMNGPVISYNASLETKLLCWKDYFYIC